MRVAAASVVAVLLLIWGGRADAIPNCPPGTHVVYEPSDKPGGRCEPDSVPAPPSPSSSVASASVPAASAPTPKPAPKPAPTPTQTESSGGSSCAIDHSSTTSAWPMLVAAALVAARRRRALTTARGTHSSGAPIPDSARG